MSLVLHGDHGKTLFVSRDSIRIVHEHLDDRRDTAILMRHIASIEVKKPGAFNGYIHFTIGGARPHDSAYSLTGGAFDAARDEHAVTFSGLEAYDVALKVKRHVETWAAEGHSAARPISEEIGRLKGLLDDGTLTEDEFAAAKRQLLG